MILFALAVGVQIFGPKPIGLSDNNDFAKILGRFGVWASPEFRADGFGYFVTDYRINAKNIWNSEMPSTEVGLAWAALQINRLLLPAGQFDMRVLGGLHAALAALAVWLFLLPLADWPKWRRAILTIAVLVIFADVEYIQFFSTAYMDAASLTFLMLVLASAWNMVLQGPSASWKWAAFFGVSALGFLGTKPQHAPCAIPLSLFAVWMAHRGLKRLTRFVLLATPAFLVPAAALMLFQMPPAARAESEFSLLFTKLLPLSASPESTLEELGRPPSDLAYNHMHAFSTGTPLANPAYRAIFGRDITTGKLLFFHLRHPAIAFQILTSDFLAFSPDLPMGNFGTMRRADYSEPVFKAKGLKIWSTLRSEAGKRWPWHIAVLYLIAFVSCPRVFWPFCAMVGSIGILSFVTGSLGDATETSRHVVLYQEATDVLLLLLLFVVLRPRAAIS